jgi:hypothetical protein
MRFMTCAFEGCGKPAYAKGLCQSHYRQQHQGRELTPLVVRAARGKVRGVCTFPDCGRALTSHGLCAGHSAQRAKGRELTVLGVQIRTDGMRTQLPCTFPDCVAMQYSKALCRAHYGQQYRGQELRPFKARLKKPLPGSEPDQTGAAAS